MVNKCCVCYLRSGCKKLFGKVRKLFKSVHTLIHPPSQCGCCVQQTTYVGNQLTEAGEARIKILNIKMYLSVIGVGKGSGGMGGGKGANLGERSNASMVIHRRGMDSKRSYVYRGETGSLVHSPPH